MQSFRLHHDETRVGGMHDDFGRTAMIRFLRIVTSGLFLATLGGCAQRGIAPVSSLPRGDAATPFQEKPAFVEEEPISFSGFPEHPAPALLPPAEAEHVKSSERKLPAASLDPHFTLPPLRSASGTILLENSSLGIGAYASYSVYDPEDDDYDLRLEYLWTPSPTLASSRASRAYCVVVTDRMVYAALRSYGSRIGCGWVEGDAYRFRITIGSRILIPWDEAYLREVIRIRIVDP